MKISIVVLVVLALAIFGNGQPLSSSKFKGFLNTSNGKYLCSKTKSTSRTFKRIERSRLCDGFCDCPNSDDELDCPCKPLAVPLNGKVEYAGDTRYTLTASFSCDPRFKLMGSESRHCLAPGKWSGENPTCMAIGCGPLADPEHGTVDQSDGTHLYRVALYECDAGYENIGGTSTTCRADGFWDETCPTCTLIDCHLPLGEDHGRFTVVTGPQRVGAKAYLECDPGYAVDQDVVIRCLESGSWSMPNFWCLPIGCGPLPDPEHGKVDLPYGTQLYSVAFYECDAGYENIGGASTKCRADGFWDETCPTCTLRDCLPLPEDDHGCFKVMAGPHRVGAEAMLECDPGYAVDQDVVIRCLENGIWSGSILPCEAIVCPETLPITTGGTFELCSGTYTVGSIAVVNCDLVGSAVECDRFIACSVLGSWTIPPTDLCV